MQLAVNRAGQAWWGGIGACFGTVLIAFAPFATAQAYSDPNSAGSLYQFLFPLIVAITSTIAGLRRSIAGFWRRLKGTRTAEARGESANSEAEPGT